MAKKIITMVGTSLIRNFLNENENQITKINVDMLSERNSNDKDQEKDRYYRLKRDIEDWISRNENIEDVSAEIKSLSKIKRELEIEDLEIYLFASDTLNSLLAAEVIEKVLVEIYHFERVKCEIIIDLQVKDREKFKNGMSNLIYKIYEIAAGNWSDVFINITGGYKATTPFLTILAQLNGCQMFYVFENSDALIKIPNIPFDIEVLDYKNLYQYYEMIEALKEGISSPDEYQKFKQGEFYKRYCFLIWEDEKYKLMELNPIGQIVFQNLQQRIRIYYITDEVNEKIKSDKRVLNLLMSQFADPYLRKEKTEIKNGHFVYDSGDNQLRIFYFENNEKVYIYKIFTNHDDYERYLNLKHNYEFKDDTKFKKYLIYV